jgi:hypothetical protein
MVAVMMMMLGGEVESALDAMLNEGDNDADGEVKLLNHLLGIALTIE